MEHAQCPPKAFVSPSPLQAVSCDCWTGQQGCWDFINTIFQSEPGQMAEVLDLDLGEHN